jgi:hypothetical protein
VSTPGWKLMNEQELTGLFRRLGAPNPEMWAHSQMVEDIPQLARFLFARQALREMISPDDRTWMFEVPPKKPDDPGAGLGSALDGLLSAGAQIEDLTTVVRAMQHRLLVGFCALLDDPGDLEDEVSDLRWRLFLINEDDRPVAPMTDLLGALLAVDPTAKSFLSANQAAMRDRSRPAPAGVRGAAHALTPSDASIVPSMSWRSMNERELTNLFQKLGAHEPQSWAHSQITEGIPQLARYVFLRQAWRLVINPDDRSWIAEIRNLDCVGAGNDVRPILDRVITTGVKVDDLTTIVRIMQWRLLAGLTVLLDQPWDLDSEITQDDMWWGLAVVDRNDNPLVPLDALIESVLETDPTGREMRPPRNTL